MANPAGIRPLMSLARRQFMAVIAGGLLAAPLAADAQQAGKVWRIGYLSPGLSPPGWTSHGPGPAAAPGNRPFVQGMKDLGYFEGRDFVLEIRWAEGHPDRLPELAADLVRAHVDVIVTIGTPATRAAMQATGTIPIVSPIAGFLVEKGIVKSLAKPGGNVTGVTTQIGLFKLYQLLKEAAPKVTRVVYLYDPPSNSSDTVERLTSQAKATNLDLQLVALRDPNNIERAFAEFRSGTNGLILDYSNPVTLKADQICNLALQRRIPAMGADRRFPEAGCLMSYSEDFNDMIRRAAGYVGKILKGAKPADLPVELATKYELIINLKAAKALGLTIPPLLLARADEVIQ